MSFVWPRSQHIPRQVWVHTGSGMKRKNMQGSWPCFRDEAVDGWSQPVGRSQSNILSVFLTWDLLETHVESKCCLCGYCSCWRPSVLRSYSCYCVQEWQRPSPPPWYMGTICSARDLLTRLLVRQVSSGVFESSACRLSTPQLFIANSNSYSLRSRTAGKRGETEWGEGRHNPIPNCLGEHDLPQLLSLSFFPLETPAKLCLCDTICFANSCWNHKHLAAQSGMLRKQREARLYNWS